MRRRQTWTVRRIMEAHEETPPEVSPLPPLETLQVGDWQMTRADPLACPKCGKVVRQGRYLHLKHCKGAPSDGR